MKELSNEEIGRYSRHITLPEVGLKGQEKLKSASVLVIGAGGLGSPVLQYLAAAGIGRLGIVDGDVVDRSNLQRQVIHGMKTLDLKKVDSAKAFIVNLNPNCIVETHSCLLTKENCIELFEKYDVICDGSDNFQTRYLANDACVLTRKPYIYGSILRFEGQVSVFNLTNKSPSYRDYIEEPPPPGIVPSCAEGGVLGVLPGTMGCLQATEVIKLLLDDIQQSEITSGRVLVFDALKMKFGEIGLAKEDDRETITNLIDYQGFCAGPQVPSAKQEEVTGGRTMDEAEAVPSSDEEAAFQNIEPKECLQKLSEGWTPWVLDVRLQTEHDIVALPFTDQVAPHRAVKLTNVPQTGDILVYCKAGIRGKKACHRLIELGVAPERLHNLDGGIMKWQKDVDPAMPRY